MRRVALVALMIASLLGGCATPPPAPSAPVDASRTTVILMPDEDGHVGAVSLSTASGSMNIDIAYGFVTIDGADARLSSLQSTTAERLRSGYEQVLDAQPSGPRSFILYFVLGSTVLMEESKALLPKVLATARERVPTEISVFGHADATGSEKINEKLAAERARTVADLLRKDDPRIGRIDVQSFGEKEPLVPSRPNVPEPRNRRVEIMIL